MSAYLDNNATTEIDPRVAETLSDASLQFYGNPSSLHTLGQLSREQLTLARRSVAEELEVNPSDLVFTSSATEAINTYLKGTFSSNPVGRLLTSSLEHTCTVATAEYLKGQGVEVDLLPGTEWGAPTVEEVEAALKPDTKLVSLMWVNNETGVFTDIEKVAELCQSRGVALFVDAVALGGKGKIQVPDGVTGLTLSAHKFHGPKGVGLLFLRNRSEIEPLLHGGHQENGMRAGTENLIGILGFSKALEIASKERDVSAKRMRAQLERFESQILGSLEDVHQIGAGPRICNTSTLAFEGVDGESLIMSLDLQKIYASFGSACSSGSREPSRVVLQMGYPKKIAGGALRFSLSRFTTDKEIDYASEVIVSTVKQLRELSRS